VARGSRSGS